MNTTLLNTRAVWNRQDIPVANYLMSHADALRSEFMADFTSLEIAANKIGRVSLNRPDLTNEEINGYVTSMDQDGQFKSNRQSWKNLPLKYNHNDAGLHYTASQSKTRKYPTACKLIEEFGEACNVASYSCLAPNSIINDHSDPENSQEKYIRIHIPLIIPKGDIFLVCNGEKIYWNDIFGFNNHLIHSAYNNTDQYRLIFFIDLNKTLIGITS